MRLQKTHALIGGLAAVAAMATLNASAQSSSSPPSGAGGQSSRSQPPSTQSPSTLPSGRQSSSSQSSGATAEESKFLQEAIRGNLAEVDMGKLAKERAQSKDVRDYGQMLIDDHSKANEKANGVAQKLGVTAPTEPSAKQKQTHDAMAKLSGAQFDSMFMSHMVQDHQEDVGKYTAQAQSGDSSKVTDYAKDTLPTLRTHLSKAQSIESKLSGGSSTSRNSSSSDSSSGRSSSSSDSSSGRTSGSNSTPETHPFGSPGSGQPSTTGSEQGRTNADDGTPSSRRAPE